MFNEEWLVSEKQWESEYTKENVLKVLTFYVDSLVLKISLKLNFCLGFANLVIKQKF